MKQCTIHISFYTIKIECHKIRKIRRRETQLHKITGLGKMLVQADDSLHDFELIVIGSAGDTKLSRVKVDARLQWKME